MLSREYWFNTLKDYYPTLVTDVSRFLQYAIDKGALPTYMAIGKYLSVGLYNSDGSNFCGNDSVIAVSVNCNQATFLNLSDVDAACKKLDSLLKSSPSSIMDYDDLDFIDDLRSLS